MSQLLQLQHASNRYYTAPQVLLAEQLCKRTGMQKAVFGNSGTEANECAIKLARKWGIDRHGADCCLLYTSRGPHDYAPDRFLHHPGRAAVPDDEAGEVTLKKRSKGARRAARPFQSAKNSWNCGQRPKRPQAQLTVYAPIKGT